MSGVCTAFGLAAVALLVASGCSSGTRNARAGSVGDPGGGAAAARVAGLPGSQARSPGSCLTAAEAARILEAHNLLRREVGVDPLVWSAELAEHAGAWASHLAATGTGIRHRPETGEWARRHGENIFMGTAGFFSPVQAVEMWAGEKSRYRGDKISWSNFRGFGHYTQIVWHGTGRVGCSVAAGASDLIVVCNYDPPGNVIGQRAY